MFVVFPNHLKQNLRIPVAPFAFHVRKLYKHMFFGFLCHLPAANLRSHGFVLNMYVSKTFRNVKTVEICRFFSLSLEIHQQTSQIPWVIREIPEV